MIWRERDHTHRICASLSVTEPGPSRLTPEEIENQAREAKVFLDDYYKPDIRNIPLTDVDMGTLIAALYNNALTGGLGTQHFNDRPMTPTEGRHIIDEITRVGCLPEIDYINGRSIKTYFKLTAEGLSLNVTRFWDYNHIPFAAVLIGAKQGRYLGMTGDDIISITLDVSDFFNDAAGQKGRDRTLEALRALAERPHQTQLENLVSRNPEVISARNYQLSIAGNGKVNGEVGHLIRPFVFPTLKQI